MINRFPRFSHLWHILTYGLQTELRRNMKFYGFHLNSQVLETACSFSDHELRRNMKKIKGNLFSFPWLCRLWAIFPSRLQLSIFATAALNFRVRNGNGWTHCVKNTDSLVHLRGLEPRTHWLRVSCSTSWARGAKPSGVLYDHAYDHRKSNKRMDLS